ncbi:MAG: hypothetical protein K2Z81_02375, partial [Cyanobacteria bacterium]|nr:hypothetical protein [Cyanobacteriota bacterium]
RYSLEVALILQRLSINDSKLPLVMLFLDELNEEIAAKYAEEIEDPRVLIDLATELGYSSLASFFTVFFAEAEQPCMEEELLRLQDFGHASRTSAALNTLIRRSETVFLKKLVKSLVHTECKSDTGKYVMVGRVCASAIELCCLRRFDVVYLLLRECPLSLVWVYYFLTEEYDLVCLTETIQSTQLCPLVFFRIPTSEFFAAILHTALCLSGGVRCSIDEWKTSVESALTKRFGLRISIPRS